MQRDSDLMSTIEVYVITEIPSYVLLYVVPPPVKRENKFVDSFSTLVF